MMTRVICTFPIPISISIFLIFISINISTGSAFNITRILNFHPGFSSFNNYLSQTKLAAEINNRHTITVLAVGDGAIGGLSGKSVEDIKTILSIHVILDYFDLAKIHNINEKSIVVTTLLQTTGTANGQLGFLNIKRAINGDILIGSSSPGSPINSKVMKGVMARPYNISVLEVSHVIVPKPFENEGFDAPSPLASTVASSSTTAQKNGTSPTSTPSEVDIPDYDAADSDTSEADAPMVDDPVADAPVADGGEEGKSPEGDADFDDDDAGSSAGEITFGCYLTVAMIVLGYF